MAGTKPSTPIPVESKTQFDNWLFLFYKWVTSSLQGLFPSGLGQIFYSDGTGGVDSEAAFTYTESTNTLLVDNIKAGTNLGLQSTGNHVVVGGGAIASEFRLLEPSGSGTDYTAFKSQAQAASLTYTWPASITTNGYLKTDAAGGLTWDTIQSTDVTDFDEAAQDTVGGILTDTATIDFTYTDATPAITADVKTDSITDAMLANMAAWTFKIRNAATTGDPSNAALADFTAEAAPATGDFLVGFLDTGEIRKFDVGNLPSGGFFNNGDAMSFAAAHG